MVVVNFEECVQINPLVAREGQLEQYVMNTLTDIDGEVKLRKKSIDKKKGFKENMKASGQDCIEMEVKRFGVLVEYSEV